MNVLLKCSLTLAQVSLILLHIVVIAMLIPVTSEDITYSGPIDIEYISNENIKALIRLEDPLKCMDKAELKYTSTETIADSKNLTGQVQVHMKIELRMLKSYSNTTAYISFYTTAAESSFEKHNLFTFKGKSWREPYEKKHECLNHCTIIFNIKEVFKHFCQYNSRYKNTCCESNESSLPPVQPTLDHEPEAKDRDYGAKTNKQKQQVKIDIFPNENELYYTPGKKYNFECNASSFLHNPKLQIVVKNSNGNEILTSAYSDKTSLKTSFTFTKIHNKARIYCHINEFIKSQEITLFVTDRFKTSTERLEASSAVFYNTLSDNVVMKSTDSTELSTSHGQEKEEGEEGSLKLLWYIGPILVVLCVSVGVLYFYFKRKKNNASRDTDVYTYTTQQQLMYAQLELDSSKSHPVPRNNEGISYTTIVGVLKPKQ